MKLPSFTRRKFLGASAGGAIALGSGTLSAPPTPMPGPLTMPMSAGCDAACEAAPMTPEGWAKLFARLGGKIPDWKLQEMWSESRPWEVRDPNILALRSVSNAGKHAIAHQREFKRHQAAFWERANPNNFYDVRDRWLRQWGLGHL